MYFSDPLPDLRHWQGRQEELNKLHGWFRDASFSLVGICGIGGTGKSTLAAKAFVEVKGFREKCWIDLLREPSLTEIMRRALQAFGMSPNQVGKLDADQLRKDFIHHLQKQPYLLAIDNLEVWLDPAGKFQLKEFEHFLADYQYSGSKSVILLTSKEYPSKYYTWRNSEWLYLNEGLAASEGAALLKSLGVKGTDQDCQKISEEVQGHPLTLCWIANELRLRDRHNPYVGYLLNNLHSLSQLGGQYRENLNWNGQQLLNWNFQRLPLALQKTLAQLSILQQPFTCIMATDVAGRPIHTDDLREIERRTLIEELKESDQYGNKQFQLLPVTAQFLQQQLTEPDRQNAHTGALKYYRAIAKRSGWKTFDDYKEILQIVHHACELLQYRQAFKEIWHEEKHKNLDEFLKSQSHNLFRKELYTSLAQAWEANLTPQDWTDYALLLNCLGSVYQDLGDYKQADAYYRSAFAKLNCGIADTGITVAGMAEALLGIADAQMGLADTRMGLRIVEPLAGRFKTAEECYRNAVDLFQCTPPISSSKALEGLAKAWLGLSKICCSKAQYTDAISLIYREVLPKFKELNDRVGQARSWNVLGYANQGLKNFKQAIYWHEKVLTVFNGSENRLEQVDALSGLGASYSAIKDYKLAGDFYNKVQKFSTEIGHRDFYAKASEGLKQLETVKTDTPSPLNGNHSKRGEDGRDSNSEAFIAFASILSFAAAFFLSYLLIMLGMRGWTPFTFRATLPWVVPSPAPRLSPVFRSDPDALPQLLIQFRRGDG